MCYFFVGSDQRKRAWEESVRTAVSKDQKLGRSYTPTARHTLIVGYRPAGLVHMHRLSFWNEREINKLKNQEPSHCYDADNYHAYAADFRYIELA